VLSPAIQSFANQLYSVRGFTGRGFQIEGRAKEIKTLPLFSPERLQIATGEMLSTMYPYRKAMQIRSGGRSQSDDSLLWHLEPMQYKKKESRQRERIRIRNRAETSVLEDVFPLGGLATSSLMRPDTTRLDVRRRRQERKSSSGSSGGGGSGWGSAAGGGSGSSGGGWGSAAGG
jgi:uncharacterized membrane protein YgcG